MLVWEKAKGFGGAHDELNSLHSLGATWILVARVPVKIRWRFHPRPRATAAPRAPRVSPPLSSSQWCWGAGIRSSRALRKRKLRLSKVNWVGQGHVADKR